MTLFKKTNKQKTISVSCFYAWKFSIFKDIFKNVILLMWFRFIACMVIFSGV